MSTSSSVIDTFYGLADVAGDIDDDDVNRWLGALVLLLAEEVADRDRVAALAREAATSVGRSASPSTTPQAKKEEQP